MKKQISCCRSRSPGRRLKYANLSWQMWPNTGDPAQMQNADKVLAKWTAQRARKVKSPLVDVTIAYCHQGESTDWGTPSRIINYDSHRKGQTGGTTALFTDSHAELVPGDRIGWPWCRPQREYFTPAEASGQQAAKTSPTSVLPNRHRLPPARPLKWASPHHATQTITAVINRRSEPLVIIIRGYKTNPTGNKPVQTVKQN